jgi:hypothetical protein
MDCRVLTENIAISAQPLDNLEEQDIIHMSFPGIPLLNIHLLPAELLRKFLIRFRG